MHVFLLAAEMEKTIGVATFNVLAPCWASPAYYFESSKPLLKREKRRAAIIRVLQSLATKYDFIALQETQQDEIGFFKAALEQLGFGGFSVNHDDSYWAQYITADPPFASNGVALYWNMSTISMTAESRVALSDGGNHCVIGTFRKGRTSIRVVSCHLDSDRSNKRLKEAKALVARLPQQRAMVDIIAGDFNFNSDTGPLNNIFHANQFVDVLQVVGKEEATHQFTSKYAQNNNFGIIDHVMVRNATPRDGEVLNYNVWRDGATEEEHVNLTLQRDGSDHFVVTALITVE